MLPIRCLVLFMTGLETRPTTTTWLNIDVRFVFSLALAVTLTMHGVRAEPPAIELLSNSTLPSGPGLAAKLSESGHALADHPSVIFSEDFEAGSVGATWDEVRNPKDSVLSLVDRSSDGAQFGRQSLMVTANLDQDTGGGMTKWYEPCDPVFIRFYTQFASDCDYVHHFCTLRANKSLSGSDRWSGFGGAGELPDGEARFSTAIEPWGDWGNLAPPGRWNFYSYWHEMTPSPDGKYWGNAFRPETQPTIPRGKWICVEFMLKHNTPGKPDGEQAYWIDGKLIGHWRGYNWRTSPSLWANAFTLESYVTDRWTKQKKNVVYFDNVVIAKEYLGQ